MNFSINTHVIQNTKFVFLKKKCFISFLTKPNTDLKPNWGTLANLNPIMCETHRASNKFLKIKNKNKIKIVQPRTGRGKKNKQKEIKNIKKSLCQQLLGVNVTFVKN